MGYVHQVCYITGYDWLICHEWNFLYQAFLSTPFGPLRWRHRGLRASQTTDLSTVCYSSLYVLNHTENINALHCCLFVWGNHRWPLDSPHKRSVIQREFRLTCNLPLLRVTWILEKMYKITSMAQPDKISCEIKSLYLRKFWYVATYNIHTSLCIVGR